MKKYIGIDIGGMSIKAGLVLEDGTINYKTTIETEPKKDTDLIVNDLESLIDKILNDNKLEYKDIDGIGIGVPGSVFDEKGIIRYCCNINFKNTPLKDILIKYTGIKNIRLSNDANCATLAETLFGAAKGAQNTVMITLGTGVGTGFVVNGKLLTGNKSAGAEGGHMQINIGGTTCNCGKKGHYEAYASAKGLMNQIKEAAEKHPESLLNEYIKKEGLDGKIVFECAKKGDKIAVNVLKKYVKYVGMGLVNYANIFYPEIIIVGGGVSNAGDDIVKPIQRYVSKNVFGAEYNPKIKVVAAILKNDAGIIGAAALCM